MFWSDASLIEMESEASSKSSMTEMRASLVGVLKELRICGDGKKELVSNRS
jgi:hypothetical protein